MSTYGGVAADLEGATGLTFDRTQHAVVGDVAGGIADHSQRTDQRPPSERGEHDRPNVVGTRTSVVAVAVTGASVVGGSVDGTVVAGRCTVVCVAVVGAADLGGSIATGGAGTAFAVVAVTGAVVVVVAVLVGAVVAGGAMVVASLSVMVRTTRRSPW